MIRGPECETRPSLAARGLVRPASGDRRFLLLFALANAGGVVAYAPYLTLLPEHVGQREHALREVFNGLRYVVKTGAPWRWMPNDLPPWAAVYQQAQRWWAAGCFEALAEDLRTVLRLAAGRKARPGAAILDSRTLRSSPESGTRAGYDGAKRKKGSKLHLAVDTLGHLLALHVTPASVDDRAEVGRRLVRDYERYASTLADLHLVAFACIMLKQAAQLAADP